MSIIYDPKDRTITLQTLNTTYQMEITPLNILRHLYYGRRIPAESQAGLMSALDIGYTPNPYELRVERDFSQDIQPSEYSAANTGDFRVAALDARDARGRYGDDLRYAGHAITRGKYALAGLPCAGGDADGCDTLSVTLCCTACTRPRT